MSRQNASKKLFGSGAPAKDPGASGTITVDRSPHYVALVSAGAEARTLARPTRVGAKAVIYGKTLVGTITLTVTGGFNANGDTTFSLTTAGNFIILESFYNGSAYVWLKTSDHNTANLSPTELAYLDGVTAGTGAASKALVLDANGDVTMPDLGNIAFGGVFSVSWDTTDANANQGHIQLPTGGVVDVPVIVIGQGIDAVDSARYDGVVNPTVAVYGIGAVATGPVIETRKSRGTFAAPTVVTSGDDCGVWRGFGCVAAGEYVQSAEILMETTGTIATTRGPGVITFKTATDAAPSVLTSAMTIGADQVVTTLSGHVAKSLTAAAITGATVLTAADSGGTFTVAKTSAYAITLPTPAQGIKYKFVVLDTGANAVTISDGSAHLLGTISINNTNTAATGTTLTLASGGSIGDWVEFEAISATQWLVTGACIDAADIAIS